MITSSTDPSLAPRPHLRCLVLIAAAALAACGGDSGDDSDDVDANTDNAEVDASARTFPAVCQELPLECPDAETLAACEQGLASSFSDCSYLPITTGCAVAGCPSGAQLCRTAEDPAGVCTHSCIDDEDCPLPGGGVGQCALVVPEADLYTCLLP